MNQVSSRLWNIPAGTDWNYACQNAPRNVMGIEFARPDRCVDLGFVGEWGEWDVPDTTCLATPPAAPVRGGTGTLASTAPMEGYADLHVHQMAHLGFGGSIVWGAPYGDPAAVLGPIPSDMKQGHDRTDVAQWTCHGASNQQWVIEPLRANDYERLYQADKDRIAWLAAADASYPITVTVDGGRAVCRSMDATQWVGIVSGSSCVGNTYAGTPVTTSSFERLMQMK